MTFEIIVEKGGNARNQSINVSTLSKKFKALAGDKSNSISLLDRNENISHCSLLI